MSYCKMFERDSFETFTILLILSGHATSDGYYSY